MFKFSNEIEEVKNAVRVCYEHGLFEAAEALDCDLTKTEFIEVLQGIPWAGKALAESVAADIVQKDDMPDFINLKKNAVELSFNGIFAIIINLDAPNWDIDYYDNGEYDLADEEDYPFDYDLEYMVDGPDSDE